MTRHVPRPGDGWVDCGCGRRHWGLYGAAGLLLGRRAADGTPTAVVLQHRALWSHEGGTWGVPGGAREPRETAVEAALREAREEAGIAATAVEMIGTYRLVHPDWSYTTVIGVERQPVEPCAADAESIAVRWVAVQDVPTLPLLRAFRDAWPTLLDRLTARSAPGGVSDGRDRTMDVPESDPDLRRSEVPPSPG